MKKINEFQKIIILLILIFIVAEILISIGIIKPYQEGILIYACINALLALSLNLISGFLGDLSLGHAGFMAIGAYTSAYITKNLNLIPLVEFPIAIVIAGLATALFGALVSIPSLRLKGDYLAIITLAFGEIVRNILNNLKIVGGAGGLAGISKYTSLENAYFFLALVTLFLYALFKTRQGRMIIAIREDSIAATSCGIDEAKVKRKVYIMSAFLTGIGGALYAHHVGLLQPSVFTLDKSIELLAIVVLGGMGSIKGSIIASLILTVLPEALRFVKDYRMLLYALALITIMLFKNSNKLKNIIEHKKEKTYE